MDITFIRTFLELCQTRHFGKTAHALYITQSAVSARIRHLEEQLGVKLLTRERNNIQLTPAGLRFQRHAENIVSVWNLARQDTALEDENRSLLSIGAMFSLWDSSLQNWLGELRQNRTDIAFQVEAQDADTLLGRIREGALDLGFLYDPPPSNQMVSSECGSLELVMVSNEEGLDSETALQRENYILVNWGTEFLTTHARLFTGHRPALTRVNLGRLALDQISRYGGSAYLARDMAEPYITNNTLYYVAEAPVIERRFFAAYAANSQRKELI
ncbi:MAG: LysR family transcriptional regulator, partial [Gammaproteobacteria bacterium]|nr:LysR family transcriptional regulator [Gammaproteobacteria bacterium]